jgi:SAM-dependent methyltransferase
MCGKPGLPPVFNTSPVGREAALWALRLFIGREPANLAELDLHASHKQLLSLRTAFVRTHEFEAFLAGAQERRPSYAMPLAFLRAPEDERIPWRFAEPTLAEPMSQLCTASQLDEPAYAASCEVLGTPPVAHRKLWEFVWILACMERAGIIAPGRRALGFGVGRERIPAVLAARGVEVLASDAPADLVQAQGWASTGQHSHEREQLFYPTIVAREDFDRLVQFSPVDMNAIPDGLRDFDVCWSSCCLEHLGSIEHGLRFIESSLQALKPGGLAVHTTEFNLSSDEETFESPNLSLFRRSDILRLVGRLIDQGHEVWPLNFHPGDRVLDEHVDLPPFGLPHLKLAAQRFTQTSIGIAVRRGA